MLRLNLSFPFFFIILIYLNTSHVKVKQPTLIVNIEFQCNLNTSHVKVKPCSIKTILNFTVYLNTSHVKVKQQNTILI